MAYNDDLTWEDNSRTASNAARQLIAAMNNGLNEYNEWQSFRAGRTDAQIATALSRTEDDVAAMDAAFSAMKMIYDYANNQTPSQSDYLFSLRKFA